VSAVEWVTIISLLFEGFGAPQSIHDGALVAGVPAYFGFVHSLGLPEEQWRRPLSLRDSASDAGRRLFAVDGSVPDSASEPVGDAEAYDEGSSSTTLA